MTAEDLICSCSGLKLNGILMQQPRVIVQHVIPGTDKQKRGQSRPSTISNPFWTPATTGTGIRVAQQAPPHSAPLPESRLAGSISEADLLLPTHCFSSLITNQSGGANTLSIKPKFHCLHFARSKYGDNRSDPRHL
jgi:hypothetical protein